MNRIRARMDHLVRQYSIGCNAPRLQNKQQSSSVCVALLSLMFAIRQTFVIKCENFPY